MGAGQAAGQAAASLRQLGSTEQIAIIGQEPHIPYQRPPLSKQYLVGTHELNRVTLRPEKFYADRDIECRTGCRVTRIDSDHNAIELDDGETMTWDTLVLATGTSPRKLDVNGHDLDGVHYLRTIADCDAIRADLESQSKVAIIGGGYIGLEVAASCRELGHDVLVVEMEDRVLKRVTTPVLSTFFADFHRDRDVEIRTNTRVLSINGGSDNRVSGIELQDGSSVACDVVIIGVGVLPNVELAEDAGLPCDNGIVVDEYCRTDNPNIYAIGDCTNHPNPILGRRLRLECVPNAMDQARNAATNIVGREQSYEAVPWFWSDQYDMKFQMAGFSDESLDAVVRGEIGDPSFCVFYLDNGTVSAADAVNSPGEFLVARKLVGKSVEPAKLADTNVDLKTLA